MKLLLIVVAAITFSTGIEAANLSIAKKVRIDLGEKTSPLGTPTNSFAASYPTRDLGFLLQGGPVSTNFAWQRFTATGGVIWSNSFPFGSASAVVELASGDFACLAHRWNDKIPWNTLFVIAADGSGFTEYELPKPRMIEGGYWLSLDYTTLHKEPDGLLVGGYGEDNFHTYRADFVMKLSSNFTKLWQRDYGDRAGGIASLAATFSGEYLFAYSGTSGGYITFASVSTNGAIQWQIQLYGRVTGQDNYDWLVSMLACNDAGVLVGFSSSTLTGGAKTAPYYGASDIWLVKLDKDGSRAWDRSFGGAGWEYLESIQQTEDGGFLVAGRTFNSQVSGNKTVDGNGVWLLKLTERGYKESESVIESDPPDPPQDTRAVLLTAPVGYRLAAPSWSWIADLAVRRTVEINARSTGKPFRMDYSFDLLNWTNLVTRFNGVLSLEEEIDAPHKFYRSVEIP